jgi:hypothetical protein
MLPEDMTQYDIVHVAQKSDITIQLSLIHACRERGARLVSAGTYPGDAQERPQAVCAIVEAADIFFMNKREATAVFGSLASASTAPGKLLFITMGAEGAIVIQGATATAIPAVPTGELDPTGAGDTFCGATLAFLLQNKHPIMAARRAVALAAEMIIEVGPAALLSMEAPPVAALDVRAAANMAQVTDIAAKIGAMDDLSPRHPFTGPVYPPAGHPKIVTYFFAATLQQFGFWSTQNDHYHEPMIAAIGGNTYKGSDYLWAAFTRRIEQEPDFCSPERQANLSRNDMLALFRADNGADPLPALDLHLQQARSYGHDMLALGLTPQAIVDQALASPEPLQTFLRLLDQIGGYKEDPLRKKSSLLALILNQRPESFLPLREDEVVPPIVDYHNLRSALRIGLVDVNDEDLYQKLSERALVSAAEEWAVRYPTYRAMAAVHVQSGKQTEDLDWFFFNARRRCPEMSEPDCPNCPLEQECAQHTELFQPVLRTTFY